MVCLCFKMDSEMWSISEWNYAESSKNIAGVRKLAPFNHREATEAT